MKKTKSPFKFELTSLLARARALPAQADGISINLPFVSLSLKPDDSERKAASEVVIRLADRRVLNAFECCDDCIEKALASLQEIRRLLVAKQVQIADHTNGGLYLLIETMLEGIRQFFTFEEGIKARFDRREMYFAALESLRAHLHRCLTQVAVIAGIEIPKIPANMRYDPSWELDAYVIPKLPEGTR